MSHKDPGRKRKVLIFCADGRQAPAMIKAFAQNGCEVTAYCYAKHNTGYLSRYSSKKILYQPAHSQGLSFMDYGRKLIEEGGYDLSVPLGDRAADYLSAIKEEISPFSAIAVPDRQTFLKAFDKRQTMQLCEEHHIPAPRTVSGKDLAMARRKAQIPFPCVIKPSSGIGSIGFHIVKSDEEIRRIEGAYDNAYGPLLLQEYVEQGNAPQYGAELFRDRNGILRAALVMKVVRWYPLDGGSRLCSVTVHEPKLIEDCARLLEAMDWNGYANIDLVRDVHSGKFKILEVNGRTGATVRLDMLAGVDIAKLILENELEETVHDQKSYPDGIAISCLPVDLLWCFKSKNRFKTEYSPFLRHRLYDVVWDREDPLPFFGFLLQSIRDFKKSQQLRKR